MLNIISSFNRDGLIDSIDIDYCLRQLAIQRLSTSKMFYLQRYLRVAKTNGFWIVSYAPQLPRKMTKTDDKGTETPRAGHDLQTKLGGCSLSNVED